MANKVLVVGATGATGRAVVADLLARGHQVTAFTRRADAFEIDDPNFQTFVGDATQLDDLRRAVQGHDAVTVTLGITENPLWVRLRGASKTPTEIRSIGTRNVIEAMREHGVQRLIVQTTYGVGDTWSKLSLMWKFIFWAFLKPQILDTEVQEQLVRASDLDWVLVEPVALTDGERDASVLASSEGEIKAMSVSRASVAHFIGDAVEEPACIRQTFALSNAA